MTNWEETTLGEVARNASRSFDFSSKEKVVFVNTGDVSAGKFLHGNYSKKEGLPGQAKKAIKKGDILFSEIRPENKRFALVDFDVDDYMVSTKFMVIERNEKIDPRFLYILLTSNETLQEFQIIAESRSGTFPQITFDSIANFPISLPSLEEQKEIASVLSSLDDKIELLREENKTLEATAQAIFKEWFVNFNFPDAEGKPYKSSGGKMIDSELGEIPEGWRVGKLGEYVDTVLGGTPNTEKKEYWENGKIPWINSGKVNDFRIYEPTAFITEKALDESAAKLMPKGTVVIAITGATLGQFSRLEIDSTGNQSVIGLLPNNNFSSAYLYYWIMENISSIVNKATGGAQQHINKNDVNNVDFVIPKNVLLESYSVIADPVIEKISENCFQIQTLSTLRDTLLPKLMSGEVQVNNL